MRTTLLTTAAMLLATPAWAGYDPDELICTGIVTIDTAISKSHKGSGPKSSAPKTVLAALSTTNRLSSACSRYARKGPYVHSVLNPALAIGAPTITVSAQSTK